MMVLQAIFLAAAAFYLVVAIVVTITAARLAKRRLWRRTLPIVSILVFVLIPTWDSILGRIYHKRLCEAEGGLRVYKEVVLGDEYWNEDGSPRFLDSKGWLESDEFDGKYQIRPESGDVRTPGGRLRRDVWILENSSTGEVLASHTIVYFDGGWVERIMPGMGKSLACHRATGGYKPMFMAVFKRVGDA